MKIYLNPSTNIERVDESIIMILKSLPSKYNLFTWVQQKKTLATCYYIYIIKLGAVSFVP